MPQGDELIDNVDNLALTRAYYFKFSASFLTMPGSIPTFA
jgi:hypothetical protein